MSICIHNIANHNIPTNHGRTFGYVHHGIITRIISLILEQEISKAATKHFPKLQQRYGSLEGRLKNLGLPGVSEIRDLNQDLAEILESDASDLPQRLGSPDSTFYRSLKWAADVTHALEQGLEKTIGSLREHLREIQLLPAPW